MSAAERRRMVDTLVSEYRDRQHAGPAVDLAEVPPIQGRVDIVEHGEVRRDRLGRIRRIGYVDRAGHRGQVRTWRWVLEGGRESKVRFPTRREAVRALLGELGVNPDEFTS